MATCGYWPDPPPPPPCCHTWPLAGPPLAWPLCCPLWCAPRFFHCSAEIISISIELRLKNRVRRQLKLTGVKRRMDIHEINNVIRNTLYKLYWLINWNFRRYLPPVGNKVKKTLCCNQNIFLQNQDKSLRAEGNRSSTYVQTVIKLWRVTAETNNK